jgi:hypothetical protein
MWEKPTSDLRMIRLALGICLLAIATPSHAQESATRTRNVVLIVTDGLRWQEVFSGAERALIGPAGSVSDTSALLRDFWRESALERRSALLPFFWNTIAKEGQIFGNPAKQSTGTVTNGLKFSYPGYNEMILGAADSRIRSNSYGPNPNTTVFEWLNAKPAYRERVAVFATWGAFRDIFNAGRSKVDVRAGWEPPFPTPRGDRQALINDLFRTSTRIWADNAFDALTHQALLEYVRTSSPRVLFVGYGETDEWAHAGRYDLTLRSARQVDAFIGELWQLMQSMPAYRGTTTFIITTDHGRGDGPVNWKRHGEDVAGAEGIWLAILGPDTPALGERANQPFTQAQIASTLAKLLGEDWRGANAAAANEVPGTIARRIR